MMILGFQSSFSRSWNSRVASHSKGFYFIVSSPRMISVASHSTAHIKDQCGGSFFFRLAIRSVSAMCPSGEDID